MKYSGKIKAADKLSGAFVFFGYSAGVILALFFPGETEFCDISVFLIGMTLICLSSCSALGAFLVPIECCFSGYGFTCFVFSEHARGDTAFRYIYLAAFPIIFCTAYFSMINAAEISKICSSLKLRRTRLLVVLTILALIGTYCIFR